MKSVVTPIQKRLIDIDLFHHVNNVAQQSYFDVGKSDYYNQCLGIDILSGKLRCVVVSTSTNYLSQVRYGDNVEVKTWCKTIGTKSITLSQQLCCGERICSESTSVLVAFDFTTQQSVEIPQLWRDKME